MGGKRQYVVKGTTFEVDDRYEVKKGVGQGAYGLICAAKDTASEDQVCWPWNMHRPSAHSVQARLCGCAGGHQEDQQRLRGRYRLQAHAAGDAAAAALQA